MFIVPTNEIQAGGPCIPAIYATMETSISEIYLDKCLNIQEQMVTLKSWRSPVLKLEFVGKRGDESCLSQWKTGIRSRACTAGVGCVSLPHQKSWPGHWMGMAKTLGASLQRGLQACMGIFLRFH